MFATSRFARIRVSLAPGITENQLWALLHDTNIAHDGEWIECRLLASGERTNPWFQECGNRVIEPGDLVGFDTDMVGPFGYLADVSRTSSAPAASRRPEQRKLYDLAQEQVLFNIELFAPASPSAISARNAGRSRMNMCRTAT